MLNLVKMLLLHIGSYDFKFKNNLSNDIKIKASTNGKNVNITILELKNFIPSLNIYKYFEYILISIGGIFYANI